MNKFVIFIGIALLIHFTVNIYVAIRGAQAFSLKGVGAMCYYIIFALCACSFLVGMIFPDSFPVKVSSVIQHFGNVFFFAVLYLFAIVLIIDIIRLLSSLFNFCPEFIKNNYSSIKLSIGTGLILLISIMFVYGNINFNKIRVKELTIDTGKNVSPTKIVMLADVHLGYTVNKKMLQKFVSAINAQEPDVVLIAGDLIDRSMKPLLKTNMDDDLKKINAPLGVYSVFGNHEYIGGDLISAEAFFTKSNIILLRDTSLNIDNRLMLVGRDDKMNSERKSLLELTDTLDKSLPVILLDHQPFNLNEAKEAKVDLQLSGHVHNGQTWPGNLIAKRMYEISYGYGKKDSTHYYVTSGLGIWGPHIRIGTQSELVVITIK